MKDIYLLEFQKILTQNPVFDDKEQLYGALKRNVSAVINPEIKSYDTFSETFSLQNIYDYESEEMTEHDLTNDYAFQQWSYEQNEILKDWQDEIQIDEQKESENQKLNRQKIKNYNGLMLEIFLIICNEDLKNMLPSNSIIARDLINIFKYNCTLRVTSNPQYARMLPKELPKDERISEKVFNWLEDFFKTFINDTMDVPEALELFAEQDKTDYEKYSHKKEPRSD